MSDKGMKNRRKGGGRKIDRTWLKQGREYFDRGNDEDTNIGRSQARQRLEIRAE